MRKWSIVVALLLLAGVAPASLAARHGSGGPSGPVASISFAAGEQQKTAGAHLRGDLVSFKVDALRVKERDLDYVWVANWCYQGGYAVSAEHRPVMYAEYRSGLAGTFTLDSASWQADGAECTAYAYVWPNTRTPLDGASISYQVVGEGA